MKKKYIKPEINVIHEIWKFYKDNRCYRKDGTVCQGGYYEISDFGRVKKNGEIVEPNKNKRYLSISTFSIHRAVAELFVPNSEGKPEVDHIDGNKYNNRYYNLRWVTHKENINNPITRKRISKAARNRPPVSEEIRQKRSEAMKGEKNPNYGKPKSEEWKQKRSEAMKGEKNPMWGKQQSEETRKKRSESMKGKNTGPRTEETIQKISESLKGMKWMSNGIKRTYVHKEQFEKYIEMGYHFGMK